MNEKKQEPSKEDPIVKNVSVTMSVAQQHRLEVLKRRMQSGYESFDK